MPQKEHLFAQKLLAVLYLKVHEAQVVYERVFGAKPEYTKDFIQLARTAFSEVLKHVNEQKWVFLFSFILCEIQFRALGP